MKDNRTPIPTLSVKPLSPKKMCQLWDAEIAKAWKDMQQAIALTQSQTSS